MDWPLRLGMGILIFAGMLATGCKRESAPAADTQAADGPHDPNQEGVRIYDIRDLVVVPEEFTPPPAIQKSSDRNAHSPLSNGKAKRLERTQEIIAKMVQAYYAGSKEPDTLTPTIKVLDGQFDGQVMVTQPAGVQDKLKKIIEQMREQVTLQIAVETGVFLLDRTTLDALATRYPHLKSTDQMELKDAPGDILPESEMDAVLKDVRADKANTQVQSPRVTLFNKQLGYVGVTQSIGFISAINGTGADATAEMSAVNFGLSVQIRGTANADRTAVELGLDLEERKLERLDTVDVVAQPVKGIVVQKPVLDIYKINTTVTVPNKKCLVLGGIKIKQEGNADARYLVVLVRPQIIIQTDVDAQPAN